MVEFIFERYVSDFNLLDSWFVLVASTVGSAIICGFDAVSLARGFGLEEHAIDAEGNAGEGEDDTGDCSGDETFGILGFIRR